jgi:hypothetical protein
LTLEDATRGKLRQSASPGRRSISDLHFDRDA